MFFQPLYRPFTDFDRSVSVLDEFRRRFEQALAASPDPADAEWPVGTVTDTGPALVVTMDVPGLTEKDVQLSLTEDVLTLKGARHVEAPAKYATHRQERSGFRFARSFTLPLKVNAEAVGAVLKDGVLTVTMPKSPESQPRQISVKSA